MQRFTNLLKRSATRSNIRLAIVAVVLGVGGFAVYQGVRHLHASAPTPITKKVVTGPQTVAGAEGTPGTSAETEPPKSLYPASSPVPPASLPPKSLPSTAPPATPPSRYAASLHDDNDPYANMNPYGAPPTAPPVTAPPTTAPPPPTAPEEGYGAAPVYGALSDGPAPPATQPPAELPPTGLPAEAYVGAGAPPANPYRRLGEESPAAGDESPATVGEIAPVANDEPQPPASPSTNPYANPYASSALSSGQSPAMNQPPVAMSDEPLPQQPATIPGYDSPSYDPSSYGAAPRALEAAASVAGSAAASSAMTAGVLAAGPRLPVGGAPPLGAGLPGERTLEGAQTPSITLEKIAPAEIQVGKVAIFETVVRNVGQVSAQQVVVNDHVPRGTKLLEAQPQPEQGADGSLVWQLGEMQPGDETTLRLTLMPQQEGEIGSVAQVAFAAHATARAVCTRPLLTIEQTIPERVLIGESITMAITVTNPGTGAATGVVIEEDVPEGLSHVAGRELEYEIGTLRPGESKRLELMLTGEKAGAVANTIRVHGDANLAAEHVARLEVIAPQLQVDVSGPKKRFLDRQATYTLSIANPGTAAARDVEMIAYLPKGMKFVDTDSQGQYDPQQHAVYWSLDELPAAKSGAVKLTTLPIEAGEQRLRVEGRAGLNLTAANEQVVQVEAAAELQYSVTDLSDPIEIGSETVYQIRVTNVGSKAATNIRINALLTPDMQALGGAGPTKAVSDAQRVNFEPLARLDPQDEAIFQVQAQALRPGDHIFKVQLSSDEWPTPITREESTRVYQDQ
jgi:uncharacterized repeat protein (TIGR01451 family)